MKPLLVRCSLALAILCSAIPGEPPGDDGGAPQAHGEAAQAMDHPTFRATILEFLRRQGFEPIDDEAERERLLPWLESRTAAAWSSTRNAAFTRVGFELGGWSDSSRTGLVEVAQVEALYHPATHSPERVGLIEWSVFTRQGGYPRIEEGVGSSGVLTRSADTALCMIIGFDGRRLLLGQYPGPFYRTSLRSLPDGTSRREYHLVNGSLLNPFGREWVGFGAVLAAGDVLITEGISEADEALIRRRFDVRGHRGRVKFNPWSLFLDEAGPIPTILQRARTLSLQASDPSGREGGTWWRSPELLVLLELRPQDSAVGASAYIFDAVTGLPLETSTVFWRDGSWQGYMGPVIEYATVTSAEGTPLSLPGMVLQQASGVSSFFARALGLRGGSAQPDPSDDGELVQFFIYHEVNSTRLATPESLSFQALAERLRIRMAPLGSNPGETFLHPGPEAVFGPPRNDAAYLEHWDAAVLDAILRAGVPIREADILPFREIMARQGAGGPKALFAYYLDAEGQAIPIPAEDGGSPPAPEP